MTDLDVTGTITIEGAPAAAGSINQVTDATKKLEAETKKANAATSAASASFKNAAGAAGQAGSALGAVGGVLGQVSPQLGGMASSVGGLTSALGSIPSLLNPTSLAIAGVTAAFAYGVTAWNDYKEAQEKADKSIREGIIPTLQTLINKMKEANEQATFKERVASGQGTRLEQTAFLQDAQNYRDVATARLRRTEDSSQSYEVIAQRGAAQEELRRAEEVINYRRQLLSGSIQREQEQTRNARTLRAIEYEKEILAANTATDGIANAGNRRVATAREQADAMRDIEQERLEDHVDYLRRMNEAEEENLQATLDVNARLRDQEIRESNDTKDAVIRNAQLRRDFEENANQEREEIEREASDKRKEQAQNDADIRIAIEQAVAGAVDMAGQSIVESAKNAGESEREIAKKQAAATVITSSVKAAIETAESIAAFATGNIPGGIAHGMAAAAFIQAAVLAGGQKLPPAESADKSGEGGTRSPGGGPRKSSGGGEGQMAPIVVNIGSSGLVYAADRVQLGRDIDSMVTEARGRMGRGM